MTASTTDFDFLRGPFDVRAERLRDPFEPGSGWTRAHATSTACTHFAGAISLDEMWFDAEQRSGLSLRLFDPVARRWEVYWITSDSGRLQAPVAGRWDNGRCWLTGTDEYRGRPVLASYAWSDVTETSAHWEQCFSVDDGATWQPNFTMDFARRGDTPEHPISAKLTGDFDFLAGTWRVRHRKLSDPFGIADQWTDFEGVQTGCTYFNGAISVDEVSLGGGRRGLTFRTFDPATRQWSIYWVNSADGQLTQPPVVGGFADGIGTFRAREQLGGRTVDVRFAWSDVTAASARWEQAFSFDDGLTWRPNWIMDLTRISAC